MVDGNHVALMLAGSPETRKDTGALNAFVRLVVTVTEAVVPCVTLTLVEERNSYMEGMLAAFQCCTS
jgi:hypothetical protein